MGYPGVVLQHELVPLWDSLFDKKEKKDDSTILLIVHYSRFLSKQSYPLFTNHVFYQMTNPMVGLTSNGQKFGHDLYAKGMLVQSLCFFVITLLLSHSSFPLCISLSIDQRRGLFFFSFSGHVTFRHSMALHLTQGLPYPSERPDGVPCSQPP